MQEEIIHIIQKTMQSVKKNCVLLNCPGKQVEAMEELGEDSLEYRKIYLKHITSLANSQGGIIYIGVKGKGLICGVKITKKEMDNFSLFLDRITRNHINPKCQLKLCLEFFPVLDRDDQKIRDTYLVKLQVHSKPNTLYLMDI